MAAFAGGPLGGAAAGLVLRSTKDLLQGEKLSTAVGKSVKTAAYGALAGLAIQGLTDGMADNIATGSEAEADAMMKGFEEANFTAAVDKAVADAGFDAGVLDGARNLKMSGNINGFFYNYNLTMTADQVATYQNLSAAANAAETFSPEYYEAAGRLHGFLSTTQDANESLSALAQTIKKIPKDAITGGQIDQAIAVLDNADEAIEKILDIGGASAAAAQGALQTVDDNKKEKIKVKPIDPKEKEQLELALKGGEDNPADDKVAVRGTESVSYADAYEHLYEQYLTEAPAATATADAQGELPLNNPNTLGAKAGRGIKGALGKVGGAIKKGASAVGGAVKSTAKELGQKITVKKLNSEWEKMGSPTDSGSIYNLLSSMGISNDNIQAIGQEANVSIEKTADGKQPEAPATATHP